MKTKKLYRKIFKGLLWSFGIIYLLGLFTLEQINTSDYKTKEYYKSTLSKLEEIEKESVSENATFIKSGWAKANITPQEKVNMVGYGLRGEFEDVHDSLYVRSIIFSNGVKTIAYLSYDLLIIHPHLEEQIKKMILKNDLGIDDVYFTATHVHSSFGGWAPGPGGSLILGGSNEKIMNMLLEKTNLALENAKSSMETVTMKFQKINASSFVKNRLKRKGPIDPWIRLLILKKENGEIGIITTFAAHATTLSEEFTSLSGGYPKRLIDNLEVDSKISFASFSAGAVGSQGARYANKTHEKTTSFSRRLSQTILKAIDTTSGFKKYKDLQFHSLKVDMGESQLRVTPNLRLRQCLFNWFFGNTNPKIDVLKIGNNLFLGTSCDYSGEFNIKHTSKNNLIITSFNGGYIGYIIPEKYYNFDKAEAREMNWYGKHSGTYYNDLIQKIIDKF